MNNIKSGSFYKLLAFALLVLLLILLAVMAVNGQEQNAMPDDTDNDQNGSDPTQGGDDKINTDQSQNGDSLLPKLPEYTYYLTGTECSADESDLIPYAVITHSASLSYGISMADMVVEVPIENGETRLVVYYRASEGLGKIGALAPSRANIDELIDRFGGISVAYSSDNSVLSDGVIDLDVKGTEFSYLENAKYVYTSAELLSAYALEKNIKNQYSSVPVVYNFVDFGKRYTGIVPASSINLPFSSENSTAFAYSSELGSYVMQKNGANKTDALNASLVSFTNVFVLFSDSTTYEKASGIQTVISTAACGSGIYFTAGTATEIRWQIGDSGISFSTLDGTELKINRGSSYIGYYKSADADGATYE